jgi:hypothetical protein
MTGVQLDKQCADDAIDPRLTKNGITRNDAYLIGLAMSNVGELMKIDESELHSLKAKACLLWLGCAIRDHSDKWPIKPGSELAMKMEDFVNGNR